MKNVSLLIVLVLSSYITFGQGSFSHSIGASGFLGTRNATLNAVGIIYSPRLNIVEINEATAISIGTNFGIAFNIDGNFIGDNQVTFHVPVIINYNFGLGSSKNTSSDNSGAYFGIGYSFEQAGLRVDNGNFNETTLIKKAINGPIANLGYRFKIGSEPFGIRGSYLYGTNDFSGGYLLTLSIQYILN